MGCCQDCGRPFSFILPLCHRLIGFFFLVVSLASIKMFSAIFEFEDTRMRLRDMGMLSVIKLPGATVTARNTNRLRPDVTWDDNLGWDGIK